MKNLEFYRKESGLTPSFIANKLGINYRKFRRIELGQAPLKCQHAKKLALIYSIPTDKLIEAYERSVGENDKRTGIDEGTGRSIKSY